MTSPTNNGDKFVREVGRQADRRRDARGRSVWQGLGQVGTVGWMVALPAVGGAFLGRWADGRYETGIFWTLSLLTLGLAIGCVAAWRAMNRELHQ
ncbi:MAG TPA: AtpZ/AtpI family protein [Fimbriiglobus sp.]|jgi:ATP synthase protein I